MAKYHISVCTFCGEYCSGKFCASCRSKEGRTKKILQQLEIEKENKAKGWNVPYLLFGWDRGIVLERHGL